MRRSSGGRGAGPIGGCKGPGPGWAGAGGAIVLDENVLRQIDGASNGREHFFEIVGAQAVQGIEEGTEVRRVGLERRNLVRIGCNELALTSEPGEGFEDPPACNVLIKDAGWRGHVRTEIPEPQCF